MCSADVCAGNVSEESTLVEMLEALGPLKVQQTIVGRCRSTEGGPAPCRAAGCAGYGPPAGLDPAGATAGVTRGADGPDRRDGLRSGSLISVPGPTCPAQEPEQLPPKNFQRPGIGVDEPGMCHALAGAKGTDQPVSIADTEASRPRGRKGSASRSGRYAGARVRAPRKPGPVRPCNMPHRDSRPLSCVASRPDRVPRCLDPDAVPAHQ